MFLPPIIFLLLTNLIGDGGGILRHDNNLKIVKKIMEGKSVQSLAGEYNHREIRRLLIEKLRNKNVDCIAVGPSLIFRIGKESVESSSFYNLGFNHANHYDFFAVFAWLKLNNIKYKKIIICMDFVSLFHCEYTKFITLWKPYVKYYNYMINILESGVEQKEANLDYLGIAETYPYFSISYFHKSLRVLMSLLKRKKFDLIEEVNEPTSETKLFLMSDGSVSSTFDNENRSDKFYQKDYKKYISTWEKSSGGNFDYRYKARTSDEFKNHFLLLIDYLIKNKVEIVFFYSPIPPIIWDKIDYKQYPGLYELDTWSRNLAKEKGIKTVGSYNPHECGVTDDCFEDTRHLKRSAVIKHFRF